MYGAQTRPKVKSWTLTLKNALRKISVVKMKEFAWLGKACEALGRLAYVDALDGYDWLYYVQF